MQQYKYKIKRTKERLFTTVNSSEDTSTDGKTTKTKKQKWLEKQLYGYCKRQTSEILHEKTQTWLRKGNIKK